MSKVVVNLRLDKGLVERIDEAGGPRGRTKLIVAALEAFLAPTAAVDPRPVPSVDPRAAGRVVGRKPKPYAEFVVASSLVTPQIKSEWEEIMASRQARLNRTRDGAA